MKGKFKYTRREGLPGGANEMKQFAQGKFSIDGYKRFSPDVNNAFNIIPSGDITMKDVDFPVYGVDNLGNSQIMYPGNDYKFPGSTVFETPLRDLDDYEEAELTDEEIAELRAQGYEVEEVDKFFVGGPTDPPPYKSQVNSVNTLNIDSKNPNTGFASYNRVIDDYNDGRASDTTHLYVTPTENVFFSTKIDPETNQPIGHMQSNGKVSSLTPEQRVYYQDMFMQQMQKKRQGGMIKFPDGGPVKTYKWGEINEEAFTSGAGLNSEKFDLDAYGSYPLNVVERQFLKEQGIRLPGDYEANASYRFNPKFNINAGASYNFGQPSYNINTGYNKGPFNINAGARFSRGQSPSYNLGLGYNNDKVNFNAGVNFQNGNPYYNAGVNFLFKDGGATHTYNGTNYRKEGDKWLKEVNGKFVPMTKGNVAERYKVLEKNAQPISSTTDGGYDNILTRNGLTSEQYYIQQNQNSPDLSKQRLVNEYKVKENERQQAIQKQKEAENLRRQFPTTYSDNTRTVIPQQAVQDVNNTYINNTTWNSPEAKAQREAQQKQFEKELWQDYSKMSIGEKALDRLQAFAVDPYGMTARFITGDQSYYPGMGRGLLNHDNPNYKNYLRAVGYTPGEIEPYDIGHIVNPMYWFASIGNNINKGNYGTAALESALTFAPFLPKGTVSMGNVARGTKMLADDFTRAGNYLTEGPLKNVYNYNPFALKEIPIKPGHAYRATKGPYAYADYLERGVVGTPFHNQELKKILDAEWAKENPNSFFNFNRQGTTALPSFSREKILREYGNDAGYIFETNLPVKKKSGRHGIADFPYNETTGKFIKEVPDENITAVYPFKPHWFTGFNPVKRYSKQLPDAPNTVNNSFKEATNQFKSDFNYKFLSEQDEALQELKAKLSPEPLLDNTNIYSNEELLKKLKNREEWSKKLDDLYEEYGQIDPKRTPDDLNDVYPHLKERWDRLKSMDKSITDKFITKEQENFIRTNYPQFADALDVRNKLSKKSLLELGSEKFRPKMTQSVIDYLKSLGLYDLNERSLFQFEPGKMNKYGGSIEEQNNKNYIEAELSLEEIKELKKQGYHIEEYQDGGEEKDPEPETMQEVTTTPLSRFYGEYDTQNPYADFFRSKKDKYLSRGDMGLQKWFNINERNFPEAEINRIYDEYQYNRNNYAIEQFAKENNIDLTDRESIMNNPFNAKILSKAMANSKYGKYLQPSLWARTKAGAVSAANALLDGPQGVYGPTFTPDIKGLTPAEEREYYYPNSTLQKVGNVADVLSFVDILGVPLMNQLTDNRDYAENPSTLGELASGTLNARTSPMAAALPNLVLAPAGILGAPDAISLGLKGLGKVGKYADDATVALVNAGKQSKQLPGSPNTVKGASNLDDVARAGNVNEIKALPWTLEELPGLHLKSTMSDGAVSKIIEPKTGLINTEQALAIIGKESGGADKVALIRQGLGDNIPKKMDYNEFRKVVQDQLIPLERQFATHSSSYGISNLGYKENPFTPIEDWTDYFGRLDIPTNIEYLKYKNQKDILENQTLILSNKNKFGRGSSAHSNPEETLGHIHFLRDAETPDVLTVTQIQSDAFQGTHRVSMKTKEQAKFNYDRQLEYYNKNKDKIEGIKKIDENTYQFPDGQKMSKSVYENMFSGLDESLALSKADLENFTQKQLLDKNHQERYLQELVDYAASRGDINKLRLPTSETAAKVQGYIPSVQAEILESIDIGEDMDEDILKTILDLKETNITFDKFINKLNPENLPIDEDELNIIKKLYNEPLNNFKISYSPEHQTILKKYSQQPKMIKKLFGEEPKIVTDSKGNTWYEFDIPESFKKGTGEIKAYNYGGPVFQDGGETELTKYQTKGEVKNRKAEWERYEKELSMPKIVAKSKYLQELLAAKQEWEKAQANKVESSYMPIEARMKKLDPRNNPFIQSSLPDAWYYKPEKKVIDRYIPENVTQGNNAGKYNNTRLYKNNSQDNYIPQNVTQGNNAGKYNNPDLYENVIKDNYIPENYNFNQPNNAGKYNNPDLYENAAEEKTQPIEKVQADASNINLQDYTALLNPLNNPILKSALNVDPSYYAPKKAMKYNNPNLYEDPQLHKVSDDSFNWSNLFNIEESMGGKHMSPAQGVMDVMHQYGDLASNYLTRQNLKNNKEAEVKTKSLFELGNEEITDGQESILTEPIKFSEDFEIKDKRFNPSGRRVYRQEYFDLNNLNWGYRNRGDFDPINTQSGAITSFHAFEKKNDYLKKHKSIPNDATFIGINSNGKFKSGSISDFDSNDFITRTVSNVVDKFLLNADGTVKLDKRNKDNPNNPVPVVKVIENGQEKLGSLNLLAKDKKDAVNEYGPIQGGRVILKGSDGSQVFVSGSIQNVYEAFKEIRERTNKPVTIITLDNGAYNMGIRTKDNRLTTQDLQAYDKQHVGGGNFLYLLNDNQSFFPDDFPIEKYSSRRDIPDYSSKINSPTAKLFKENVIDPGYKYGMSTDDELKKLNYQGKGLGNDPYIDCSGAVCKVMNAKGVNLGNPLATNAQKIHDNTIPVKDKSDWRDGDIITFATEGNKIDHIGFLIIDQKTGEKYIAESARSFNEGRIVPFQERIDYLKFVYPDLKYYIRTTNDNSTFKTGGNVFKTGGEYFDAELTPEEINWYLSQGYKLDILE